MFHFLLNVSCSSVWSTASAVLHRRKNIGKRLIFLIYVPVTFHALNKYQLPSNIVFSCIRLNVEALWQSTTLSCYFHLRKLEQSCFPNPSKLWAQLFQIVVVGFTIHCSLLKKFPSSTKSPSFGPNSSITYPDFTNFIANSLSTLPSHVSLLMSSTILKSVSTLSFWSTLIICIATPPSLTTINFPLTAFLSSQNIILPSSRNKNAPLHINRLSFCIISWHLLILLDSMWILHTFHCFNELSMFLPSCSIFFWDVHRYAFFKWTFHHSNGDELGIFRLPKFPISSRHGNVLLAPSRGGSSTTRPSEWTLK